MNLRGIVEDSSLGFSDKVSLMTGVKHQFTDIIGEASLIGFETFLWAILAAVVDGNADGASLEIKKAMINPEREVRPMYL